MNFSHNIFMKNDNFRLDMAEECADFLKIGVKTCEKVVSEHVKIREMTVQKDEEARALNRDKGRYITIDADKNVAYPSVRRDVTRALRDALRELSTKAFKEKPSVLVAGLGNRFISADAIGPKTADGIITDGKTKLFAISTGIYSKTGLESATIIRAIVKEIKANLVIVVDTLATAKPRRVFRSFQLTDAGLEPGSATQAGRDKINIKSVGAPVIALGVPTCVYARQIVLDTLEKAGKLSVAQKYEITHEILKENVSTLYCPKETDLSANVVSDIIKDAINGTFQGRI